MAQKSKLHAYIAATIVYGSGIPVVVGGYPVLLGYCLMPIIVLNSNFRIINPISAFYLVTLFMFLFQNIFLKSEYIRLSNTIPLIAQFIWINYLSSKSINIAHFSKFIFVLVAINTATNIFIYGFQKVPYFLIPTYPANQSLIILSILSILYFRKKNNTFTIPTLIYTASNAKTYLIAHLIGSFAKTKTKYYLTMTAIVTAIALSYGLLSSYALILFSSTRLFLWKIMVLYAYNDWTIVEYVFGKGFRTFEYYTKLPIQNALADNNLSELVSWFGNSGQMYAHSTLLEYIYAFGLLGFIVLFYLLRSSFIRQLDYRLKLILLIALLFNEMLTSFVFTGVIAIVYKHQKALGL